MGVGDRMACSRRAWLSHARCAWRTSTPARCTPWPAACCTHDGTRTAAAVGQAVCKACLARSATGQASVEGSVMGVAASEQTGAGGEWEGSMRLWSGSRVRQSLPGEGREAAVLCVMGLGLRVRGVLERA